MKHGDCLALLADLPDGSVDLILVDPPYGSTACSWDQVVPFEPMWREVWRVLKPNGAALFFGSEPFATTLRASAMAQYRYDWYWHKRFAGNFVQAKRMPLKVVETISVFSNGKALPKYYPQKTPRSKPIRKGSNNRDEAIPISQTEHARTFDGKVYTDKMPDTFLEFSVREDRGHHPTQKPTSLLAYLIETYTLPGETVLDFTMGAGSTGVAAIATGRRFIGVESDLNYFETARERLVK